MHIHILYKFKYICMYMDIYICVHIFTYVFIHICIIGDWYEGWWVYGQRHGKGMHTYIDICVYAYR
jgi:hypothetical protein